MSQTVIAGEGFLSARELKDATGLTLRQIQVLDERGVFIAQRIGGRHRIYRAQDVFRLRLANWLRLNYHIGLKRGLGMADRMISCFDIVERETSSVDSDLLRSA
jgi:hypothetical protein